ncbi:MAG: hypothetical protein N3D14_03820 [Aquificaceae bacterium]|nr:hypothetical protein [Aquificaceae bacterium]
MKLERFWLYFSLSLLLIVGLSLINLVVFLELRKFEEGNLYRLAKQHFLTYLYNPEHKGDEHVVINPERESGYRILHFEEPGNPLRTVRVGIREEYLQENTKSLIKKLFFFEFLLIFTLVLLYQIVVESYVKKLREKEEWVRSLMLSLVHRLGNFMATHRVLLAILKKSYPEDSNLKSMEKSLIKAQRDFHIFMSLVRDDKSLETGIFDLKEFVLESFKYLEEDAVKKRILLGLKSMPVRINKADLEDILYNLIGNAVKHSKSLVHIKICPKTRLLVISNDVGEGASSGMGMGVELTSRLLSKYRFELTVRLRRRYTVFISFKERG